GLTAWQAVELLEPQPGQDLLVIGARGAVGSLALQLLAARGFRARAIARGDVVEPASADGIVDAAGVDHAAALRPGGRYVTVVPGTGPDELAGGGAPLVCYTRESGERLAELLRLFAEGAIRLEEPVVFPLDDAMSAFYAFERRGGRRVALICEGDS